MYKIKVALGNKSEYTQMLHSELRVVNPGVSIWLSGPPVA